MSSKSNLFSQSANPVLSEDVLRKEQAVSSETFTISSAINKTWLLLAILLLTGYFGYTIQSPILTWGGAIAGLIVVIIAVFNRKRSALWAPLYAVFEGFFVGGVSAMYAAWMNGIVLQAVSLTLLVFFVMLVVYRSGLIPVTNKLRMGIVMATGAIFLIYMLSFVLGFFGINVPYIHEGGTFGILFSIGVIGIAALNLLLDFDLFEKAEEYEAPVYMEWFAGMSLLITIVWIYIEVLRLLSKLRE